MTPKKLYQEDITYLALYLHDWLALDEEMYDELADLIDEYLEPFSYGFRNYN